MRILVIIPCYNEQENIVEVVRNLQRENPGVDYVVINDCSTDNSEQILQQHNLNYISNPFNLGIGATVQCGYQYAVERDYDIAVQIDGDGQHPPDQLPIVLQSVIDGEADMCIGSRFLTKEGFQSSFMRRVGISIISITIKVLTGVRVKDVTSGFRVTGKKLTAFYASEYAQDFPEPEAILSALMNGYRIKEAPVLMKERGGGITSINALKSPYYMVKVLLSLVVGRLKGKRFG